jgi:microcystin degradation protein MlrC
MAHPPPAPRILPVKLFIAAIGTETNTFSPIPTGWSAYREDLFVRRDASQSSPHWFAGPLRVWRKAAEAAGHEVIESVAAFAQPAGPTRRTVWAEMLAMVLADLDAAGPVDVVLLNLHGAMVAEDEDDCEGALAAAIRARRPAAIIAVELDLHCHISDRLMAAADIVVTYKEYPHTDVDARAEDIWRLAMATHAGEIRPVMASIDCRMLAVWRTPRQPVRGLVDAMSAREGQGGVLSVSFAHGFPWADVPDVGARMIVIADGDAAVADRVARDFQRQIWDLRYQTRDTLLTLDEAVAAALSPELGVTVLADVCDNAGAGTSSDATFLLEALVAAGARDVLTGFFWDPVSVKLCFEAGIGSSMPLRIGGKVGPFSGRPVDLDVTVLALAENAQITYGNGKQALGDAALVAAGGIHIALNALRTQTFHPDGFAALGADIGDYRSVFVKSAQHFSAGFAPVANRIRYVSAGGAADPDFEKIRLPRAGRPLWPLVEDPFAGN